MYYLDDSDKKGQKWLNFASQFQSTKFSSFSNRVLFVPPNMWTALYPFVDRIVFIWTVTVLLNYIPCGQVRYCCHGIIPCKKVATNNVANCQKTSLSASRVSLIETRHVKRKKLRYSGPEACRINEHSLRFQNTTIINKKQHSSSLHFLYVQTVHLNTSRWLVMYTQPETCPFLVPQPHPHPS